MFTLASFVILPKLECCPNAQHPYGDLTMISPTICLKKALMSEIIVGEILVRSPYETFPNTGSARAVQVPLRRGPADGALCRKYLLGTIGFDVFGMRCLSRGNNTSTRTSYTGFTKSNQLQANGIGLFGALHVLKVILVPHSIDGSPRPHCTRAVCHNLCHMQWPHLAYTTIL